jgi:hypothetical protein
MRPADWGRRTWNPAKQRLYPPDGFAKYIEVKPPPTRLIMMPRVRKNNQGFGIDDFPPGDKVDDLDIVDNLVNDRRWPDSCPLAAMKLPGGGQEICATRFGPIPAAARWGFTAGPQPAPVMVT